MAERGGGGTLRNIMYWVSKSFPLHIARRPPLIYDAFQSGFGRRGAPKSTRNSVGRGPAEPARGRAERSLLPLNHYLIIHFTQPGVIMHGPVNGYLSTLCIYLIISRGGGDKSADCVHCGASSAGGET